MPFFVPGDLDLWPWPSNSSERGTKHVFRVNLVQIHSAVPETFYTQTRIWRPLFNTAMFGWRPQPECRAVPLPRRRTRWNLLGCPKLANRCQPLVGRSSPYCEDMWGSYCCLTRFFPIVDTCLSCKDIAGQSCAMVPRWWFFACCIFSEARAARFRPAFYIRTKGTPCVEVW